MARAHNAGPSNTPKITPPITNEQAARITWDSLPTVKADPVVLEVKPLFVITGGKS